MISCLRAQDVCELYLTYGCAVGLVATLAMPSTTAHFCYFSQMPNNEFVHNFSFASVSYFLMHSSSVIALLFGVWGDVHTRITLCLFFLDTLKGQRDSRDLVARKVTGLAFLDEDWGFFLQTGASAVFFWL